MTGAFPRSTRAQITKRDGGKCARCGGGEGLQIHHRRPRGAGGSRLPIIRSAANGVTLCLYCHADVESFRDRAMVQGWLVSKYGPRSDPRAVPLFHHHYGMHVTLTDQGTVIVHERQYARQNANLAVVQHFAELEGDQQREIRA